MSNQLDIYRGALEKSVPHFQNALPSTMRRYLTPERITRVVLNALVKAPTLMKCTPASVMMAVMDCAQCGLEPGGPLGHAYLVPYFSKKKNAHEAQAIIGYKGYIELACRSGAFTAPPHVQLVYSSDDFDWDAGSGDPPRHRIDHRRPPSERGDLVGGYCVAKFVGGGCHVEYMHIDEIEAARKRSKAGSSGPWVTDYGQMCRKTIIRRARNYWPIKVDADGGRIANAVEVDERAEAGLSNEPRLQYDSEFCDQIDAVKKETELPQEGRGRVQKNPKQNTLDSVPGEASSEDVAKAYKDAGGGEFDFGPPPWDDSEK